MLLVMFVDCTLLPLPTSMDIRGWNEMHPLDVPAWSLFFEYIANIFYALGLRKLSKRALSVFVFLAAILLIQLAVFGQRGDLIGGGLLAQRSCTSTSPGFCSHFSQGFCSVGSKRASSLRLRSASPACSCLLHCRFRGSEVHSTTG